MDAYEGWAITNGVKKIGSLDVEEVKELRQMLNEALEKEQPNG